jgi:hypothetical protein
MSEAAKVFWGSIVRHLLTAVCGVLITHGYVTQTGAAAYIEELTALALYAAVNVWSNRVHYWEMVRQIIARQLPAGASAGEVNGKIASMQAVKMPMPSVATL